MRIGQTPVRRGLLAAMATLAVGAVIAGVSVAGAAQDKTVYILRGRRRPCFTTVANKPTCDAGERGDVEIQTGDSVTWDFTGTADGNSTTSDATNDVAAGPELEGPPVERRTTRTPRGRSTRRATTRSSAGPRRTMVGTITSGRPGRPTATPTVTPTPDAHAAPPTPTPTPTVVVSAATPTGDARRSHRHARARAGRPAKDTEAPRLATASAKVRREGVRVRFWLSEPATVTVTARRRGSKTRSPAPPCSRPPGRARCCCAAAPSRRAPTRSSCVPPTRWATAPRRDHDDPARQVSAPYGPWRAPADASSRRDFMRNGFGSLALLCTFATPGTLRARPR